MTQQDNDKKKKIFLIIGVGAVLLLFILPAKYAANSRPTAADKSSAENAPIAIPDVEETDTDSIPFVSSSIPDSTLHNDSRTPETMGLEDGYRSGMADGKSRLSSGKNDDKGPQKSPQEQKTYTDNYRRGYQEGIAKSKEGEQALDAKNDTRTIEEMAAEASSTIQGAVMD